MHAVSREMSKLSSILGIDYPIETTQHDTKRHNTTRHKMTRHNTTQKDTKIEYKFFNN